jgi:hypothetical protein
MTLTQEQKKNLQIFLSRVTLNGSEVGAFNELVNAIFAPEQPEEVITPNGEPVVEPNKKEKK